MRSPWSVAAVVLVAYAFWLLAFFGSGHEPRDMIYIGRQFVTQSHASQVIRLDPSYPNVSEIGYDGQFFYYLALDPANARFYMDVSTYRYTRILYPMVARMLALGRPDLVPWTLWIVNWLAIAGGALAVAAWLKRRGFSPWFALVYGLYPGLIVALQRDLSEALAYGLAAAAVYVFDYGPGRRELLAAGIFALAALTRETTAVIPLVYGLYPGLIVALQRDLSEALAYGLAAAAVYVFDYGPGRRELLAAGIFALAALTRETTAVIPLVYAAGLLVGGFRANWLRAVLFGAIAIGPLALYKLFLLAWLGAGHDIGIPLAHLPFQGLWHWRYWSVPGQTEEVRTVVFPGLIAGGVAVYALWRRRVFASQVWLLAFSVLLFIIFLQADAYIEIQAASRVTTGVLLAALLCVPFLAATALRRWWLWACSALWLALTPFWLIFPALPWYLHVAKLALRGG